MVRTSRCGRDNPGSTPGGDIWKIRGCHTHASLFLRLDIRFHPLITLADQNSSQGNPARKEHVLMFVSFFVSEEPNLQTECMQRGSWENTWLFVYVQKLNSARCTTPEALRQWIFNILERLAGQQTLELHSS